MCELRTALEEYLALRRALGFKLVLSGRLLQRFVDFAEGAGATEISTELANTPNNTRTRRHCSVGQLLKNVGGSCVDGAIVTLVAGGSGTETIGASAGGGEIDVSATTLNAANSSPSRSAIWCPRSPRRATRRESRGRRPRSPWAPSRIREMTIPGRLALNSEGTRRQGLGGGGGFGVICRLTVWRSYELWDQNGGGCSGS